MVEPVTPVPLLGGWAVKCWEWGPWGGARQTCSNRVSCACHSLPHGGCRAARTSPCSRPGALVPPAPPGAPQGLYVPCACREGGGGRVEPSAQAAPSPPRRQTASPSLRSTSPLPLPRGSGVQVQVRPGRGRLGRRVEGEICQVAALGSLSWGSVDLLPCKGPGTDAGISRVWDTICSNPSVCPPGCSLNSGAVKATRVITKLFMTR